MGWELNVQHAVQLRDRIVAVVGSVALVVGVLVVSASPVAAATAPTAPQSPSAVGGALTGSMAVTWKAPLNVNGSAVTAYLVATSVDGEPFGTPVAVGKLLKATLGCPGIHSCDFRIYATNAAGTSVASVVATGLWAVPTKATITSAVSGIIDGKITLLWTRPQSNGGKEISGYLYDVQVDAVGLWSGLSPIGGSGATSNSAELPCPSSNASGGCKYRIYPANAVGAGPVSNAASGSWEVPNAPTLVSATPGRIADTAIITWKRPTKPGGLAVTYSYEVSHDGGPFIAGPNLLPNSPLTAIVDCLANISCSYRVIASNAKGAGVASNAKAMTFTQPSGVRNVTAGIATVADLNLGTGAPTVTVDWAAPLSTGGDPIISYQGRACNGNCDESDSAWTSSTVVSLGMATSWRPTCPAGLVTCSYQVRAVNAKGSGPWGNSARITPFGVNYLAATPSTTAGYVDLSWSGPAESGYGIDYFVLYSCVTSTGCTNSANWSDTGVAIGPTDQSASDDCGSGVSCTYRIAAYMVNSVVSGPASSSAVATGSALPDAPENFVAVSGNTLGAVVLTWSAPLNTGQFQITNYVFTRSINAGTQSAPISTDTTGTSFTDTGCGPGNTCTYTLAAVTAVGTGERTDPAVADGANVPSAPLALAATPGSALGVVDVDWQAPTDDGGRSVTNYLLERSKDGGSTWTQSWSTGTSLSYSDTTCGSLVSCTYRVSATNVIGTGALSGTATAIGTGISSPLNLAAATSSSQVGGVDLTWQLPDHNGGVAIAGYEFRYSLNGGVFVAWASTGAGTDLNFSHLCGETNICNYEVRAYNAIGTSEPSNQAAAAGLTDNTAPTVVLSTPINGSASPSSAPLISGSAGTALGDAATVTVLIKLGATVVQTIAGVTVTGGGTWSTTASTLADGTYTVFAQQSDWDSNTGISAIHTFTVDANAPTIVITAPHSGDVLASSGIAYGTEQAWAGLGCPANVICGTASDAGSGVAQVKMSLRKSDTGLYWNGTAFASAVAVMITATGTTSWTLAFPASNFPAGGQYVLSVSATDNAANGSSAVTSTFNIDYDQNAVVFVSPSGNSSNNGLTPTTAKSTISAGLLIAQTTGRGTVIVAAASGGTTYAALSITGSTYGNSKTVRGGYDTSTWKRSTPGTNVVTISAAGTAVLVDGKTGQTFEQLSIQGTNSGLAAASSVYGLRAINSSSVTLSRVNVTAQSGVAATATATSGTAGTSGCTGLVGVKSNTSAGSSCGGSGSAAAGAGGAGGASSNNGPGANGVVGTNGGGGAVGGSIGLGQQCSPLTPGNGGGGKGGSAGVAGAAGSSGSNSATSATATWTGQNGGSGGTGGLAGGGGGGGGGGGAGKWCNPRENGGKGGGGGGAGTAGTGGSGGTFGGGSFAVYAHNSTILANSASTLTASSGGAGRPGGNGGNGGAGGGGGNGQGQSASGSGGSGGGGSGGSGGGGGGGGAGGPSISAFHSGTGSLTVDGSATSSRSATAATGGAGGTSSGGTAGPMGSYAANSLPSGGNNGVAGATGAAGTTGAAGGSGLLCTRYAGSVCTA